MKKLGLGLGAAILWIGFGSALAAAVPITDVMLTGGGPTVFDPENGEPGADECLTADSVVVQDAYTPVQQGTYAGTTDAFDSGLVLMVGDRPFVDSDDDGNKVGEQLTVGPETVQGVQITRIDRALADSPTLRSLIKLRNPGREKTRTLTIESEFGADGTEGTFATSTGDPIVSAKDRWIIVADNTTGFEDPPVTLVNYGRGKVRERVTAVPNVIADPGGADSCVFFRFKVNLPANSTRHLLLFTQLHGVADGQAEIIRAYRDAVKFDRRRLPKRLTKGLSKGVRKNVLNWDLTG
jgi:hypothetical protein